MINPLVKTIIVDGYYSNEQANALALAIQDLQYIQKEFGQEIDNFNLIDPNFNDTASTIFNTNIVAIGETGVFRKPELFIHFEGFDSANEWVFAVALRPAQFNTYVHLESKVDSALNEYRFDYREMLDWDLTSSVYLKEGQGILFRPWLFHSFNDGLIQIFRVREA